MSKIGPSTSAHAFVPPRSQSTLNLYAHSPASRSTPVIGSVSSLAAARPSTIVALSKPDVDGDTSESASDESDDSEDDIPLQPAAQPRTPRPGTSMSTRTTVTARTNVTAKVRLSVHWMRKMWASRACLVLHSRNLTC